MSSVLGGALLVASVPMAAGAVQPAAPADPEQRLAEVALSLEGTAGDAAGFSVAAGDLDGDGVGDVVVGAPCDAGGEAGAGAVHVFYGPVTGSSALADADVTLRGAAAGDFVGESVAVADVDGDGAGELLVGAPGPLVGAGPLMSGCFELPVQPGTNRPGELYVVPGAIDGERLAGTLDVPAAARTVLTGLTPGDFFGIAAAAVDLDDDDRTDLVVGGHGPGTPPVGGGSAYLFTAVAEGATGVADARAQLFGGRPVDLAGAAVGGGDLDGDGRADLVVGAPGNGVPPSVPGRVHVYHEPPTGPQSLNDADLVLEGETADDFAGSSIVAVDVGGDRTVDLAVGAPGADRVYVVAGGERRSGTVSLPEASHVIEGSAGHRFGHALAVARPGEGGPTLLAVGAPAPAVADHGGGVALLRMRSAPSDRDEVLRRYVGEAGEDAGYAVAVADVDGDRVDDLVVGAPGMSGGSAGRAYVVHRAAVPPADPAGAPDGAPAAAPAGAVADDPVTAAPGGTLPATGGGAPAAVALCALATVLWVARRRTGTTGP